MDTLIAFDEIQERLVHFRERSFINALCRNTPRHFGKLRWSLAVEGTADMLSDAFVSHSQPSTSFNKTLSRLRCRLINSRITHTDQLCTIQ